MDWILLKGSLDTERIHLNRILADIQTAVDALSGGGVADGDKGDLTVSGVGTVWTIDAGAVTTTKLGGDITVAGKALLDDADAAAQRTTLGLGTAATASTAAFEAAGAIATHNAVTTAHGISAFGATLVDDADASAARTTLGLGTLATQSGTFSGTSSGTNTGDQTNITGNAATVTTNANLTGHVTSVGNAAVLGSFTVAQLNTAISDADVATGGGTATGTNTGDNAVNSLYSGLVSNATHTGDATGATALAVVKVQGTPVPAPVAGDDQKYLKYNHGTTAFVYAAPAGTGDVVGPASATDNAIARFDATTGKLVQNSPITISDNGEMLFAAGGTADAPIKLQSGTNLTTAEAGAVEYDGKVFYSTPVASARGVSPSIMYSIVPSGGFALSTAAGVQSAFPAAGDVWALGGSTTYEFWGQYHIQKATNSVTVAMAFALAGGASVTSIRYFAFGQNAAVNTTGQVQQSAYVDTVASTVICATSAANNFIQFRGLIRVNAGGTVTPQINFSGTAAGTPTMMQDSYICFVPLGTNTNNTLGNVA